MKNEVVLSFCIWGFEDIDPDYITELLGIQPTKVYRKGEKKNPKFAALAKRNGWIMGSGLDKYLGSRYNRLVKELNIEFDVDLYSLPNHES